MASALHGYVYLQKQDTGYRQKKSSENFIEYFTHSKNGMVKYVSTQKYFLRF